MSRSIPVRLVRLASVLALVLALAVAVPGGSHGSAHAQDGDPDETTERGRDRDVVVRGGDGARVTLITGDVLTIDTGPDGRRTVTVDASDPDEPAPEFETLDTGDTFYVIPLEARDLVPERLDMDLFDVDKLIASQQLTGPDELPVMFTWDDPSSMSSSRRSLTGPTDPTRGLPSIAGLATELDPGEADAVLDQVLGTDDDREPSTSSATGPIPDKIWLDEAAEVTLDDSVPQVGAPAAWAAGLDGTGITTAVLDTGIDDTHPDLAGQVVAAQDFTGAGDPGDEHGHGTHVASILAGTGVGSDGARPGVAPGASLVNGRVLDASGRGLTSWVIDGMEWAAADQGVDIVNMSLGSSPTDGTDPLSQSLNTLADQHGTLFVTAAGNNGPQGRTVGSPAAADAALAVGNVWSSDFLHSSSSRGPRRGDHAIKPELTAPGVNILAARAAGTSLGDPVDDLYTEATGTSMAAPHVAGAAAILAQQHPDWNADDLTSALVTTSQPHSSFSIYEQGGGRVDVAEAIELEVLASPAPLDLGYFPYPHDDAEPTSSELTYTNTGAEPVTLDLSLSMTDEDADAPADGMVEFSPTTLDLAPGASESVTVTVDVTAGDIGLYGGWLVAEQAGEVLARTPVGFHKEGERYDLDVTGFDADGNPAAGSSSISVMNVDDRDAFFESSIAYIDGVATARVPPGRYSVTGLTYTFDQAGERREVSALAAPEIEVTGDTEVALDARDANPISVAAPAHDVAPVRRVDVNLYREPLDDPGFAKGFIGGEDLVYSAAPTDPVDTGTFEFSSRWRLADPDDPAATPVLYDVVLPEEAIPADLSYTVRPEDLATERQRFHAHVDDHPIREFRTAWRPWQGVALSISEPVAAPTVRTDHVSPADTSWTRNVLFAPSEFSSLAARMNAPRMEYQPGQAEDRTWYRQAVAPGLIEGSPWHRNFPVVRVGDVLDVLIPEYTDAQQGHWGYAHGSIDESSFRVFEDDQLVAERTRASGDFEVSSDPSTIRFELDTAREGLDWWRYSTRVSTTWTFTSQRPDDPDAEVVLPLLLVDHHLDVDLTNVAPGPGDGNGPATIEFTVRHQPGFDGTEIDDVHLWTSVDDGATWRERHNLRHLGDGRYRAVVDRHDPGEAESLSLRVQASDADGNSIDQEVIRARGSAPRR